MKEIGTSITKPVMARDDRDEAKEMSDDKRCGGQVHPENIRRTDDDCTARGTAPEVLMRRPTLGPSGPIAHTSRKSFVPSLLENLCEPPRRNYGVRETADRSRRTSIAANSYVRWVARLSLSEIFEEHLRVGQVIPGDCDKVAFAVCARVSVEDQAYRLIAHCNGTRVEASPQSLRGPNGEKLGCTFYVFPENWELWITPLRYVEGSVFRFYARDLGAGLNIDDSASHYRLTRGEALAITGAEYQTALEATRRTP